jgi:hypothetical protein
MTLDNFLEEFFSNIAYPEGVRNIKEAIKNNMTKEVDYNTTVIETQILTDDDNFFGNLCISSDGYNEGEVIFMDFNLEGNYQKIE